MMFVGTPSVLYSSFWGRFVTYAVAAVNDGHMGLDVTFMATCNFKWWKINIEKYTNTIKINQSHLESENV